jgi:hypothetical protein
LDNARILQRSRENGDDYDTRFDLIHTPITFSEHERSANPDSIEMSAAQRKVFKNLMLAKCLDGVVHTAAYMDMSRATIKRTAFSISELSNKGDEHPFYLLLTSVTNKTMAFAWQRRGTERHRERDSEGIEFYNFYYRNGRWMELESQDLLNLNGNKRSQFNTVLMRKIKALKDENIDCSDPSSFVEQVENRFILTDKGIDFCFDEQGKHGDLVVVSLTWAELSGFLKMKIE